MNAVRRRSSAIGGSPISDAVPVTKKGGVQSTPRPSNAVPFESLGSRKPAQIDLRGTHALTNRGHCESHVHEPGPLAGVGENLRKQIRNGHISKKEATKLLIAEAEKSLASRPELIALTPGDQKKVREAFVRVGMAVWAKSTFRPGQVVTRREQSQQVKASAFRVGAAADELMAEFPSANRQRFVDGLSRYFEDPSGYPLEYLERSLTQTILESPGGNASDLKEKISEFISGPRIHYDSGSQAVDWAASYALDTITRVANIIAPNAGDRKALLRGLENPNNKQNTSLSTQTLFAELMALAVSVARESVQINSQGTPLENQVHQELSNSNWLDESAGNKTNVKRYLQGALGANLSGHPPSWGTHVLGDLEGMRSPIDALVAQKKIRQLPDGRLDFMHPEDPYERLHFTGDLMDRDSFGIDITEMLLDLATRYPDRVTLVLGNRDVKTLKLLCEVPLLENFEAKTELQQDYTAWLSRKYPELKDATLENPKGVQKLQSVNTLENRLAYWLEDHSAKGALEFHQENLERKLGRPVSEAEAAQHYVDFISPPSGPWFQLMQHAKLMVKERNILYTHGGVNKYNRGFVPEKSERATNVKQWAQQLNDWGEDQLEEFQHAFLARSLGDTTANPFVKLLDYGDAVWDPKAKIVYNTSVGVVYSERFMSDSNLRVTDPETIDWLANSGVTLEVAGNPFDLDEADPSEPNHLPVMPVDSEVPGHVPVGDSPVPLRDGKYMRLHNDTSRRADGTFATTTATPDGYFQVISRTRGGAAIRFRSDARNGGAIGKRTNDGYTVVGRIGQRGKFVLVKYFNGHSISEVTRTARDLFKGGLVENRVNDSEVNENEDRARATSLQGLATLKEEGKIRSVSYITAEAIEEAFDGMSPVLFSGFSKLGQSPVEDEATLEARLLPLFDQLDPAQCVIVTGGTDLGAEKIVHRLANERGFKIVSFVVDGVTPSEMATVDTVLIAAGQGDWAGPLLAGQLATQDAQGLVVYIGGGATIGQGIDEAYHNGVPFVVMDRDATLTSSGGASVEAIAKYGIQDRAFKSGADIVDIAKKLGWALPTKDAKQLAGPHQDVKLAAQIIAGEVPGDIPPGVFGRILRGRSPEDFNKLTTDNGRDLVHLLDPSGLQSLVGKSPEEMLEAAGYTREELDHLKAEGVALKLVLMPPTAKIAAEATWPNVLSLAAQAMPHLRSIFEQFADDLATVEFKTWNEVCVASYGIEMNSLMQQQPMTEQHLIDNPTALNCRRYFYDVLHLNELFTGDGYTRTPDGDQGVAEFIALNGPVIEEMATVDLNW